MVLTDRELAEFLSKSEIGRLLNYKQHFNFTIFSKVIKESAQIAKELFKLFAYQKTKGKLARLFAIDSTDIPAFSFKVEHLLRRNKTLSKTRKRHLLWL